MEWTFVALSLGLAGVLLISGLLPARQRHETLRDRNRDLQQEIRRIHQENERRAGHLSDLLHDRLTVETELSNRGGLAEGEELLPVAPPSPPTGEAPEAPAPRPLPRSRTGPVPAPVP